jgi:hypothetical protein
MIASSCMYALKLKSDLVAHEGEALVEWHEGKPWRTAESLLSESLKDGALLLIVFADAAAFGPVTPMGSLRVFKLMETRLTTKSLAFGDYQNRFRLTT